MYRPFILLYICIHTIVATTSTLNPSTKTSGLTNVSVASRTTHKEMSDNVSTKEMGMANTIRQNLLCLDKNLQDGN